MVRRLPIITCFLFFAYLTVPLRGAGLLDLRIPKFEVDNKSIEEAVRQLREWNIPVCLEIAQTQVTPARDYLISVRLQDVSIRKILDTLINDSDGIYDWEVYRSELGTASIINILPVGAKSDSEDLLNLRVQQGSLDHVSPLEVLSKIDFLIPALARRLHPQGAPASRLSGVGTRLESFTINMQFKNLTIRDILNEAAIRSGGSCWMFLPEPKPKWEVF